MKRGTVSAVYTALLVVTICHVCVGHNVPFEATEPCNLFSREHCDSEPDCIAIYGYDPCYQNEPCPFDEYPEGSVARQGCVRRQEFLGCEPKSNNKCYKSTSLCAKNDTMGYILLQGCIPSTDRGLRVSTAIERCCVDNSWTLWFFGVFFLLPMFGAIGFLLFDFILDWYLGD